MMFDDHLRGPLAAAEQRDTARGPVSKRTERGRRTPLWLVLALVAVATPAGAQEAPADEPALAQDNVLFKAMRDELGRTMERLRLDDAQKPYFVAYRVRETAGVGASASMGAVVGRQHRHGRWLNVELRVGSRELDNTNFFGNRFAGLFAGGAALPLADDYENLRRHIWLATDAAYKQALSALAGKKAALQNKKQSEEVADFSEEEPFIAVNERPPVALDAARVAALARQVSAAFKDSSDVFLSDVGVSAVNTTISYLNSEGSFFVRGEPMVSINVSAVTQADDGTELSDVATADARLWEGLPKTEEFVREVETMIDHLAERRRAANLERYTGPVLFEGQAAAELVAQVLAPRLLAIRVPVPENPMMENMLQQLRNPFLDKIGARVLARSLSVVDDPAATDEDGKPLLGSYVVDDDSVPARRTSLVENGILKTLLSTRVPVADLPNSTGSRRGGAPGPSNLFVIPKGGLSDDELRAELLALVAERGAEHGVIVRRVGSPRLQIADASLLMMMQGGLNPGVRPLVLAYKVFPDGREELIRKAILPDFDEGQFKDIVAVSERRTRHVTLVTGGLAAGGDALTTIETPAFVFEDVTVRRPTEAVPKPPVATHPLGVRPVAK